MNCNSKYAGMNQVVSGTENIKGRGGGVIRQRHLHSLI